MLLIKKMINLCSFFKWAIPASFHLFTVFYSVKYNNFYRKLMWKNVHLVWCAGNQTHGLLIWVPSHDDYTRVPTLYYILFEFSNMKATSNKACKHSIRFNSGRIEKYVGIRSYKMIKASFASYVHIGRVDRLYTLTVN